MTHLERDLEAFFTRHVRAVGGITLKIAPTQAGAPDRFVYLPHRGPHLVELKTTTGTLSPIQRAWHERAATAGLRVHVLYGHEEVVAWLRGVLDSGVPPEPRRRTRR